MAKKRISNEEYIQASRELGEAVTMRRLAMNNDLGMEIHAADEFVMGTCQNKYLLPAINNQIKHLKRFLRGKKNKWQ